MRRKSLVGSVDLVFEDGDGPDADAHGNATALVSSRIFLHMLHRMSTDFITLLSALNLLL